MDTMQWAGQICAACGRQAISLVMLGVWLVVSVSLLSWGLASLTRRTR